MENSVVLSLGKPSTSATTTYYEANYHLGLKSPKSSKSTDFLLPNSTLLRKCTRQPRWCRCSKILLARDELMHQQQMKQWRHNGYALSGPLVAGGSTPIELTFQICPSTFTTADSLMLVDSLTPASFFKKMCICGFDCGEENPSNCTLNG